MTWSQVEEVEKWKKWRLCFPSTFKLLDFTCSTCSTYSTFSTCADRGACAGVTSPEPSGDAEERQAHGAAANRSPWPIWFRVNQAAIGARRFVGRWVDRARPCASLWGGDPSREVRKSLRRADGTLLRVVHFLAIEAEACRTKLHGISVLEGRRARPRLREAGFAEWGMNRGVGCGLTT